jgi:hypothetical protein
MESPGFRVSEAGARARSGVYEGAMRSTIVACFVVLTGCGQMMMTVDAGPPELICDPAVTTPVTLSATVQAQIFDKQCKSCHNAFDASNGDYSDAARTASRCSTPTTSERACCG